LISDLNEQSQICAQSLFLRSKVTPARTWSLKWKRDSWMQHLSGRILRPSLGQIFLERWTSSLAATHASHSQPPAKDSAPKIPDTYGHSSQMELDSCGPDFASLRTSKDTSVLDSEQSLKNWEASVTKRRGAYSARVKLALRTKESGSSSWPTSSTRDYKGGYVGGRIRNGKISMDTLDVAVQAVEAGWPTPTVQEAGKIGNKANYGQLGLSNHPAIVGIPNRPKGIKDGLVAPENHNTNGSRPESWATPRAGKTTDENPETWALRQAKGDVATMPLTLQVKNWATPQSRDFRSGDAERFTNPDRSKNLNDQIKSWATPIVGDSHLASTPEVAAKRLAEGKVTLSRQNAGKLNPRWVETLMGLPVGWTMPSCASPVTIVPTNSDSSVTESSQPPQPELF